MGVAVTAGEQMESKNPLKALLPVAISCLSSTSRDLKCFLSKATLLQCAGRGQCPPLPRGQLPGSTDGTAGTAWGQWGTLPGSSSPQPLHQQPLQAPPRTLIFVAICALDGASARPLNTSLLSRSSTRHKSTKNPSLGRRGPARMVKDQLKPCL